MSTKHQHIIHNVYVEVESNSSAKADEIRLNSSAFVQNNVLSIVESYMAEVENHFEDVTVQLEPLELNLNYEEGTIGFLELKMNIERQLDDVFQPIIRSLETKEKSGTGFKIQEVDESLETEIKKVEILTSLERQVKSILHFFKTGRSPWWLKKHDELREMLSDEEMIGLIKNNPVRFLEQVKTLLQVQKNRRRLIRQLSNKIIAKLMFEIFRLKNNEKVSLEKKIEEDLHVFLNSVSANQRLLFLEMSIETLVFGEEAKNFEKVSLLFEEGSKRQKVIEFLTELKLIDPLEIKKWALKDDEIKRVNESEEEKTSSSELTLQKKNDFKQELEQLVGEDRDQNEKSKEQKVKKALSASKIDDHTAEKNTGTSEKKPQNVEKDVRTSKVVEQETFYSGIITENAGIVLLQPFLKPFFQNLGLLNENGGLTDPILSAHILHFLATGKEEDFEFSMLIEAFLCGISLDEPLPRSVPLSDEIKKSCHELLSAVLGHWKALKSESIPLLRNEFLQREGKLFFDEMTSRIVVERTTIDILLDKLPWTISMIKLSWHKEVIYVEW